MSELIEAFYQVDEKSIPNRELYAEALRRLNNLAEYRRLRIFAGNDTVPQSSGWCCSLARCSRFRINFLLRNEEH